MLLLAGYRRLGKGRARQADAVIERIAIDHHDGQDDGRQRGAAEAGHAPGAGGRGDASHEHRRCRPAQVAREAMHREAMAQALRREALVEDGEIHRVEGRIAQAGKDGGQHQLRIAVGGAGNDTGHRKAAERGKHDGAGAKAVDHKAGQRLAHARDDEKGRHQHAELGVAEAEVRDQPGKQRRQQQVEEVRGAMGQAHQADGA